MNIAIDFGNTSLKAGLFEGDKMVEYFNVASQIDLIRLANEKINDKIIISAVSNDPTHFINLIENKSRLTLLTPKIKVPIINKYETPDTLGADRLAAVTGANFLFPGKNCLVIDAGTSITYDLITANAEYLGGNISLGISMRYKALNNFTARLPLLNSKESTRDFIGKNTKSAIETGVLEGITGEVEHFIKLIKKKFDPLTIVFCGGDAGFFETKIKEPIFVVPELVLVGLNRILNYNA